MSSHHLQRLFRLFFRCNLGIICTAVTTLAHAADVSIQPAAGSGFVIKSTLAERFRVQENGTITLPAVPGATAQPNALCISATGQLGPCAGGNNGSYSAGTGLGLTGNVLSITPTFQLPQSCTTDQIAKWNGSAWVCTSPSSIGGLPVCEGGQVLRVHPSGSGLVCGTLPNTITTVAFISVTARFTNIAIGSDGLPTVSFYQESASGGGFDPYGNKRILITKCDNTACASSDYRTNGAISSADDVGQYSSLAIGSDDLPVISYYDATNANLMVAKCSDPACNTGNIINTVDHSGNVGMYTNLIIGSDGFPVISYYAFSSGDLKVVKCGDTACSSGNLISTVDSAGDIGLYTSIAIGSDGRPIISYYDASNADLKVAKCGDAACTSGNATITTVDSVGDVGKYTSIAIGTDGLPIISYYDATNQALKILRCGNTTCSNGNTVNTIDNVGNVGQYTTIAIGADGLPVVSYYDESNSGLKVAKCSNAVCSSAVTNRVAAHGSEGGFSDLAIGSDGMPIISFRGGGFQVVKCSSASCRSANP